MAEIRRPPAFANEEWLLQQQLRAEIEAESWRRLREILTAASAPAPAPAPPAPVKKAAAAPAPAPVPPAMGSWDAEAGGVLLKALVRFGLGVFGAYLTWIAAMDGGLGEFEVWLATGSGFLVVLAASMFEPLRSLVLTLAEWLKIALFGGLALGAVWALLHLSPGPA